MLKNAVYFIFRALFAFELFKFCPDFPDYLRNALFRKLRFIKSQTGKQILLNISRSKGNQAKKFTQLKSDSHLPNKILFVCFNESPLKMMKNAFYFILKALFVLETFKFRS